MKVMDVIGCFALAIFAFIMAAGKRFTGGGIGQKGTREIPTWL